MRLDHVIYASADPALAAERFLEEYGLGSVPGGRHPGWGTYNRIIPLGRGYVELIGIADEDEAQTDPLGTAVLERLLEGDGWVGWCVEPRDGIAFEDLAVAGHLDVEHGSRERSDGSILRWSVAGRAAASDGLPFLIAWDDPTDHPGLAPADHAVGAPALAGVTVAADPTALRTRLGGTLPPGVEVVTGPRGVRSVAITTTSGDLAIA